jgi:hypothetical protein
MLPNNTLKFVPGLAAFHRMPLSGHRLASRYMAKLSSIYFHGSIYKILKNQ